MPKKGYKQTKEHKRKIGKFREGKKHSEEVKKKMSESKMGEKNPAKRPEIREKMSESHKEEKSPFYGKHLSEEHKAKIRESKKGEKSYNWKGGFNKTFYNLQRLAKKRNAEGSHTFGEWELLKKQYGFICPCCRKKEPEIILTEDHIIPLSKGGSNYIENIQPLCKSCNSKKHTKIIRY